jgi:hypothetical protein
MLSHYNKNLITVNYGPLHQVNRQPSANLNKQGMKTQVSLRKDQELTSLTH